MHRASYIAVKRERFNNRKKVLCSTTNGRTSRIKHIQQFHLCRENSRCGEQLGNRCRATATTAAEFQEFRIIWRSPCEFLTYQGISLQSKLQRYPSLAEDEDQPHHHGACAALSLGGADGQGLCHHSCPAEQGPRHARDYRGTYYAQIVFSWVTWTQGPYSSHEGLNKGFTHAFTMIFASEEARDGYLTHPEHETVKTTLRGLIDDIVVFDYALTN